VPCLGFLGDDRLSAIQSAGNLVDLFGGFQLARGFDRVDDDQREPSSPASTR
jgi:hypothetical protein